MSTKRMLESIVLAGRGELPTKSRLDKIALGLQSATAAAAVSGATVAAKASLSTGASAAVGSVAESVAAGVDVLGNSGSAPATGALATSASGTVTPPLGAASGAAVTASTASVASSTTAATAMSGSGTALFGAGSAAGFVAKITIATALVASGTTAVVRLTAQPVTGESGRTRPAVQQAGAERHGSGGEILADDAQLVFDLVNAQETPLHPEEAADSAEALDPPPVDGSSSHSDPSSTSEKTLGPWLANPDRQTSVSALLEVRRMLSLDPSRALRLLDSANATSPELMQERDLMRIEALRRLGRHEAAGEQSAQFLESYPDSPYLPQLQGRPPLR